MADLRFSGLEVKCLFECIEDSFRLDELVRLHGIPRTLPVELSASPSPPVRRCVQTISPQPGHSGTDGPLNGELGYRKPPEHTRFQPGRSGNPKGRPKGSKNLKTEFLEELGERIAVREGGRTRRLTKRRALVKTVTNKSLRGDTKSATLVLSTLSRFEAPCHHDELKMVDMDEVQAFATRLFEFVMQFIPQEKHLEMIDRIEEEFGLHPQSPDRREDSARDVH